MAIILNIETSTEVCSVSVSLNGETIAIRENSDRQSHSELLTVFIGEICKESKLDMGDINAVAIGKGPGSYTGLRIGTSVAKGICFALGKPLISVCSLEVLGIFTAKNLNLYSGLQSNSPKFFCPMIDARRMEVYTALYSSEGKVLKEVTASIIDENSFQDFLETGEVYFFGNGASKCKNLITHKNAIFKGPEKTSAQYMQSLAEEKFKQSNFENVAYFEPFYLKDFVATVAKNKVI